jgi:hypothetical protein
MRGGGRLSFLVVTPLRRKSTSSTGYINVRQQRGIEQEETDLNKVDAL